MALNDILTSMDGARDALVTAINAKGGSLAQDATLYQCANAVTNIDSNQGTDTQEPVLLSPTNVTEETLALNTATNSYGTWTFSASNKASGYEPSALFMESYDNFTFEVESTHWLLVECTNTFAPESLYFYAGGSNVLGYTPKTLEIYGTSNGVEYLLGTATLVSTDQDANGLKNTVEATIGLDHGGRTYSSIKIIQTSNQTNTSVQAIWRKIEIRGYDTAVVTPCTAEYYKCASVDTGGTVIYGKTLVVSGAATSFYNGTYTLQDATATGYNRVWVHSNEEYALSYFASESTEGVSSGFWGFYKISDPSNADYSCKFNTENPWDNPTYISKTYEEEVLSIIHPTSTTGNTWSGYKAVFDSTAGTWSFEDTVTEGLSYIGITPVVGKIYSADTTIQVGYIKLDGILNDETVKFLLYPKLNGTLEDVSTGGNGVTVTNTGSVAVENDRIVFGEGKALTIPANTLPNDIFVSGSPFIIEFQGIIPTYTGVTCCPWARKEGSMNYTRLDMYLNTIEGDSNYGQMTIGYWTNNVTVPVGAFTVGAEHVVAFEYDGNNTSRVYLDGVFQYSFTGTDYLPFRTVDFMIGHDTDEIGGSNGNPFQGNMSYFRIRNVAPYLGSNYTPEWV